MADKDAQKAIHAEFTDSERALLLSILKNLTADVQFDADAVARELKYKGSDIVKTRWRQIKKTKLSAGTSFPLADGRKRKPPKKTTPKKRAAQDSDDNEGSVPTMKTAKRGGTSKGKTVNEDEDDEEIEQVDKVKKEEDDE